MGGGGGAGTPKHSQNFLTEAEAARLLLSSQEKMLAHQLWRVLAVLGQLEQRHCLGSLPELGPGPWCLRGRSLGEMAQQKKAWGGPALPCVMRRERKPTMWYGRSRATGPEPS